MADDWPNPQSVEGVSLALNWLATHWREKSEEEKEHHIIAERVAEKFIKEADDARRDVDHALAGVKHVVLVVNALTPYEPMSSED